MERYFKYREQIKRMAPEEFSSKKVEKEDAESAKEATLPNFTTSMDEGGKAKSSPYYLYLRKRKRWFVIKLIALGLVVAGFIVWWFLMQGRKV